MLRTSIVLLIAAFLGLAAFEAAAATYAVGPAETYGQVADLPALVAGDIVEIVGGNT